MDPTLKRIALSLALVCATFTARAEGEARLVSCAGRTISVFRNTTSPDGRWAIGWTIRSVRAGTAPEPWLVFDQDAPMISAAVRRLQNEDGSDRSDDLVTELGWVDLKAKHFSPVPTSEPIYPGRPRSHLDTTWRRDGRYVVVIGNHEGNSIYETKDAWLFAVTDSGPRQLVDLKPAVMSAIRDFMRTRDPKDAARYLGELSGENARWRSDDVELSFSTMIPSAMQNVDAGIVTLAIPDGSVRAVVADPVRRKALRGR
jgi:hypothetical protein